MSPILLEKIEELQYNPLSDININHKLPLRILGMIKGRDDLKKA
jgi:hypothetical protein